MLKKIRIALSSITVILVTLLFLDFTGTLHAWFGFLAKIQFLPAILAMNLLAAAIIAIATLIFGRIYCSIICPLGILQDVISNLTGRIRKNRFRFSKNKIILRLCFTAALFLALIFGIGVVSSQLEPYGIFGRITSNLLSPIYRFINNILALFAERANSYAFYSIEIWLPGVATFIISVATFLIVGFLSVKGGRTYCNSVCPVGTILGFFAKFSLFRPTIDGSLCNKCSLCEKNCKASCINSQEHKIDLSRCVTCFNCIGICRKNAISYSWKRNRQNVKKTETKREENHSEKNISRHDFLSSIAVATASVATTKVLARAGDGGFADILPKKTPERKFPIKPAGSQGLDFFTKHCTGCQLCVSICPNQILRPSSDPKTMMQPGIFYERGYCRPECTKCSDVCPTGAIQKITKAEKSSIQIGHATWHKNLCLVTNEDVICDNCSRHCPTHAITMIPMDADVPDSPKIPMINTEKCIGCGACENLCPVRPVSAITVEGHLNHRII